MCPRKWGNRATSPFLLQPSFTPLHNVVMDASSRQMIYRFVRRIPPGKVLSYGDVARLAGTGPRQVAAAMRGCPAGLPWHRVVGAGGRIRTPGEVAWMQHERLVAEGIRFRGPNFQYAAYQWKAVKDNG